MMPVTAFDAVYYHLPLARHMLDTGTVEWTPWIFNSSFPQNYELLQAIGLAIGGDASASLVSWWFAFGTVLALVAIGARLGNHRLGLWASIALSLTPLWFWLGHVPYNECGIAFGLTMIALFIIGRAPGWALGLAIGWLAGVKYYGLEIGAIGFVVWLWQTRPSLRHISIAILVAAAISIFWYARNIYLFANPIFPYYHDVFGFLGNPLVPEAVDCVWKVETQFDAFARPSTLLGWLTLPTRIIFSPAPDFNEDSVLAWKYVGVITWLWPFGIITVLRRQRGLIGIYAFALIAVASWVVVHGIVYLRFLTPVLPMMYFLSFSLYADAAKNIRFPARITKYTMSLICILAIVHLFGPTTNRSLIQLPLSSDERQQFLEANIDGWPIIRELNDIDPEPVVYYLYGENVRHYCEFPLFANWRDPHGYAKFGEHATSGGELAGWLESIGVDVLLINKRRANLFDYKVYDAVGETAFLDIYKPALTSYKDVLMLVRYDRDYEMNVRSFFDEEK